MQWLPSSFLGSMLVLCGKAEYWKKATCFRFCFLDFVNSVYELTNHRSLNWFRVSILYICINEFSHSNSWSPDHICICTHKLIENNWSLHRNPRSRNLYLQCQWVIRTRFRLSKEQIVSFSQYFHQPKSTKRKKDLGKLPILPKPEVRKDVGKNSLIQSQPQRGDRIRRDFWWSLQRLQGPGTQTSETKTFWPSKGADPTANTWSLRASALDAENFFGLFKKPFENSQLLRRKNSWLKKPWTTNFHETLPNLWFSQPWQLVFEATNGPSFPTPEPSYAKDDIDAEAVSEIQERNRANNPANHYKRPRFESTWVCDLWVRMQVVPWG